jgi:DNA polymerase-3 subunit epsilon
MAPSPGISERSISKTPISIVDIETTGLYPGGDRVVELAVVRIEPNEAPRLVLDTLVNPKRRVAATEIHGITDADVADAPPFEEIAGNVATALAGSVFASYNVYFDAKFLQEELSRVGMNHFPPHLCLMYLRPMLGLGKKCSLGDACRAHGIIQTVSHKASADALMGTSLWRHYADTFTSRRVDTFGDLAKLKEYKFVRSFSEDPLPATAAAGLRTASRLKPRSGVTDAVQRKVAASTETTPTMEYWDALKAALADLTLTTEEVEYLIAKQRTLRIPDEQIRWLHGCAFAGLLTESCKDRGITSNEVASLSRISAALRALGWAPGDPLPAECGFRPPDLNLEKKKSGGLNWLRFWK